jgi:hypothetical protein
LRWLGLRCILAGGPSFNTPDTLPVELLLMLLASYARFDLLLSRNVTSACASFGDSYAFGIAGTGGTSSSSSWLAELWRFRAFGAGSREPAPWGFRCGTDVVVEVRIVVLKLALEVTERPELYDFRFRSGVVREEEGVDIFRGSMEGERDERPSPSNGGGFGNSGVGGWP